MTAEKMTALNVPIFHEALHQEPEPLVLPAGISLTEAEKKEAMELIRKQLSLCGDMNTLAPNFIYNLVTDAFIMVYLRRTK